MHTVWHRLSILFFLPGQTIALPPFASLNTQNTATKVTPLFPREAEVERDSFDSSDLSWIKKLTAIGDSYSAGIGAGDRLGSVTGAFDSQSDWSCSRYDQAYPNLINNDARLGDPGARKFQFKSCSGATTEDVLEKQIPSLDKDQQAIILSIGGNDVELSNVLNQCIYQWAVINQEQVALAKATALDRMFEWATGFDWEALGRGCAKQLDHTRSLIEGEAFSSNVDKVLEAAKTKLAKDGKIYFTGYGKFFGEKMSPECDDVSWSTWIYKTYNIFQPEAKLTVENRRRMNELVDSVNNKLREAAERAGSSVTFIDYDKYIGEFGGRYCEPGVDESTNTSNSRPLLMFYKLNTRDPMGETPWKRSKDNPLPETFSGSLDTLAEITLLLDPDAKLIHDNQIEGETASEVFHSRLKAIEGAQAGEGSELEARNLLPDGYGRVFHPQTLLHKIIANRVIYEMINDHTKRNQLPSIPETLEIGTCSFERKPPELIEPTHAPKPPPKPVAKNRQCHKKHKHKDVHDNFQEFHAYTGCNKERNTVMKEGSKDVEWHGGIMSDWYQSFKVSWIKDCKEHKEQSVLWPVEQGHEISCATIMRQNYKSCNNGGAGGYQDVGCLRYNFFVV